MPALLYFDAWLPHFAHFICNRNTHTTTQTQKEQKEFKPSAAFRKNHKKISEVRGLDFGSDFFPKNRLEKQTKKCALRENPNRIFLKATTAVRVMAFWKKKFWGKACGKIRVVSSIG